MVLKVKSTAEKNSSDNRKEIAKDLALFVTLTRGGPKNITVAKQVVLKLICKTPVLLSTKEAGLMSITAHENVAKIYACKAAKGIMDIKPGRHFFITIANLGKVDLHLPKHQTVGEAAKIPVEIVLITDERYSYTPVAHANNSNCSVNTVHDKPTPN